MGNIRWGKEFFDPLFVISEIIEKIDIGGISLIRAAAKNFNDVIVISQKKQYEKLLEHLKKEGPYTSLEIRKDYAAS